MLVCKQQRPRTMDNFEIEIANASSEKVGFAYRCEYSFECSEIIIEWRIEYTGKKISLG